MVVKVHTSVGLMAGGTSLVIKPSEWPKPLNGVAQVAPCSTICHQKSLEKGGERKKRLDLCTIWPHREQVGSQSSLKVPLSMILALWQGSLVWLLLGGGVGGCVWTGRHISSVWLGGEIV